MKKEPDLGDSTLFHERKKMIMINKSKTLAEYLGKGRGAGNVNPKPLNSKNVLSDDRIAEPGVYVKGNFTIF